VSRVFAEESGMAEGFNIGTLSRLVERKGHSSVIRSISKVAEKYPNVRYFIAGAGRCKSYLKKLVKSKGVGENVFFLGRLDEKYKYSFMKLCDIFAMPSKKVGNSVEGFGIVFVEAAACGTPSIATDSGGISDAIEFGKTGIKVDTESPNKIAQYIEGLIENKKKLSDMGGKAKKRAVKNFDYKRMVDRAKKDIIERI
jgi:phosphatidylinositol alpha-1,6-mannosyltransferase